MTKIIYDASVLVSGHILGNENKTGLYRVSYEILSGLLKLDLYEIYLFDVFYRERELEKYILKQFPGCLVIRVYSKWYRRFIFPLSNLADNLRNIENRSNIGFYRFAVKVGKNVLISLEKIARKIERKFCIKKNLQSETKNCSLYFSTYFPIPVPLRQNINLKKIYTIHDMIPLIHPEYFSSSFNTQLVKEVVDNIEKNDYVICVSESTKRDLFSYQTMINPDQVFVAHLAAADFFSPVSDNILKQALYEKYKIPVNKKYLLSVCTFEPRKNLKTLISAYSILLKEKKVEDMVLVLTGAPYWGKDFLLDEITFLNNKYDNPILITGFVPDNELVILYSGAYAFVYPSFYEGFGLPPLEAMQCGVPVISSNTSSLPEVVDDCGILIDPKSETELAKAIILLNQDQDLRNTLSQRSLARAANFTWANTTSIIKNVFDFALSIK